VAFEAVICSLMTAAQAGDFMTANAGVIGRGISVKIAVRPMWCEGRHAPCAAPPRGGDDQSNEDER